MRRQSEIPEVVGMPFLDLICCAFGGIILLYLMASPRDGETAPVVNGMDFYIVESGAGSPPILGMRLEISGGQLDCWGEDNCSTSGSVQWDKKPGQLTAAVKNATVDNLYVGVVAFSDPYDIPEDIKVRVTSSASGIDECIKLERRKGFRAKVISGSC